MGRDNRKFRVDVGEDQDLLWPVLATVESAAAEAAKQYEHEIKQVVSIAHSTGEYKRDTVAEARATAERSGFSPTHLDMEIHRLGPKPERPTMYRPRARWIQVLRWHQSEDLEITVSLGTELEVNGVFAMLQEQVKAAIDAPQQGLNNARLTPPPPEPPPAPSEPPPPGPWWKRALNHAWTVEVVGGLVAAVVGSLVVIWLVAQR